MMAIEKAIFAGGCFWCMVQPFDQRAGVISVISGYTAGHTENPTYKEVCAGNTGHIEAVEITFDNEIMTYEELVEIYWMLIDPTDLGGQFVDRGESYKPVIFYTSEAQKQAAEASKAALAASAKFERPIVVPIEPAKTFYAAEDYHQDYYRKNPLNYKLSSLARDTFITKKWGR